MSDPAAVGGATISPAARVMRGATALLSTQPLTWAATLLTIVFMPRYLDSAALGQWSLVVTVATLAGAVLQAGVPMVLVRDMAADPARTDRLATRALVLLVGLGAVGGAIIALAFAWLAWLPVPPLTLELALASMVVSQALSVALAVISGQQRMKAYAWLNASTGVIGPVLGVLALAAGGDVLTLVAISLLVSLAITPMAWRNARVRIDRAGLGPSALLALARSGLPFLGMTLVTRARGDAEVFLLGLGLSVEALGWWTAANRIIAIPLFIPTLLMTPLLPALSGASGDREIFTGVLRRTLQLTILLTFSASAAIVAFAPLIPTLLGWPAEFSATIPLMQVLACSTPLISIGIVMGVPLVALGEERRWFVVSVLGTVAQLLTLPFAMPAFAAWVDNAALGAASVRFLVEAVMIGGALVLLPRGTLDWSPLSVAARATCAGAVMVATAWSLPAQSPYVVIGGSGLVYVAALLLFGAVRPAEIRAVLNSLPGRRAR